MGLVVTNKPKDRYINMNICRARAGILHVTVWILLYLLLNTKLNLKLVVLILFLDFAAASTCGLTPLTPTGLIAWAITRK